MYTKISGFSDEIASDINTQFEALEKLGIKYFEPRSVDGKNISELEDGEVLILKEKMDKSGIKVSSIGSPIGKIKITDDLDVHFELFKRVVKTAKMLETKYIRIFSFYHDDGEWTKEERGQVFTQLKRYIAYARKNDVVLLHENEKDIYGDITERCLDIMGNLYCDNFRAVFDPANFVQCGQDTKKAFEVLKPYIAYMHIKDALAKDNSVVPAGMGDGNVEYILKNLFKYGYDGFLSLEPHLGDFDGFSALEKGNNITKLEQSDEAKFILAYNSLITILNEIK